MNIDDTSKVALFVFGLLDDLESKGLAKVSGLKLTRQGRRKFKQMWDSGYRPPLPQMQAIIECIKSDPQVKVEFINLPPELIGGNA